MNLTIIFFITASVIYSLASGNVSEVSNAALSSSTKAMELVFQLAGTMAFWGGLMKIAEASGLTKKINLLVGTLLHPLFKGIDKKGSAMQAISMNVTANLLGIGNAATPLGISAIKELVREEKALGTTKNIAMLILLNTASIQLMPVTISMLRFKYGSASPWDCTAPILLNSLISLIFGCSAVYLLFGRRSFGRDSFRNRCTDAYMSGFALRCSKKS